MLHVEYTIRDQWGSPVRHPVNDAARLICALAGTKTITPGMLSALAAYGGSAKEVLVARETVPPWHPLA
jgi:hypothetical protein